MVDFVTAFAAKTELSVIKLVGWLGLSKGKFYSWKERYGRVNEHNANVPRDHWIEDWERDAIIEFHGMYPLKGYRRLTFMMLDKTDVAVSPSTTYRVLRRRDRWNDRRTGRSRLRNTAVEPRAGLHLRLRRRRHRGVFLGSTTKVDAQRTHHARRRCRR